MKGKFNQINKKKKGNAVLQRYKVALDEFVKNRSSSENVDHSGDYKYVKKKSRKELRKEKRKLKRAKMKSHYEGKRDFTPLPVVKKVPGKEKNTPNKKKRGNVDKDLPSTSTSKVSVNKQSSKSPCTKKGKTTKLQETRKQALMQANEQEDKEIKKLERSLGLNKRKNKKSLPQSFVADGLDYILGVLDCGSSGAAMYDSEDDMDVAKISLSKIEEKESERSEDEEWQADSDDMESLNGGNNSLDGNVEDTDDVDSDDDHKESNGEDDDESMASDAEDEEETTSALMMADHVETSSTSKYTPPHLRNIGDDRDKVEFEKLKRKLKGLLNRLSEPNMASISGQLEEMYMSCSRKVLNDTLTDVLLAVCVTPSLMPDRLLMEHVLLVSILHHTVGIEVGAHFLETIVRKFHDLYKIPCEGKECDNLIAIIAHLYNFQVVHSLLIFDVLKLLMQAFTEKDIELILFVLRNVGFTLRKDDALALKDLISEAQHKATDVGKNFNDQTRVRFMLETMLALKNNDMRKIPGYDPEPVERFRKLQRSLISQSSSGSDMKLRVSLDCLLRAEQVGRWWIVGSSWSGAPMISNDPTPKITPTTGQFSSKVLELARKQRMNTEVRRNIFCVLMTSEDYLDAFEKLLRMGLKDKQEREIVHVLLHCCLQEKTFNAFYAVLGEKFCTHDRRFQMTFQFSLWDKFKEIDNLSSSTFNNLVQIITCFLQRKCLPLSILKVIEFGELDKPKVRFLRQMLTKLLRETEPEDLACIFGKISGIPKLGMLREGLKLFINHFVLKNAQSQGPAEQAALLSDRAQVATRALEAKEAKLKL